jgi:hypothetical protein
LRGSRPSARRPAGWNSNIPTGTQGLDAATLHAEPRAIDVDSAPLQLVADAFLCGRRIEVEPFIE